MSQERYSRELYERYLPVATAAASQVPKTAPSLPNTLPYGPHGFVTAGAPNGSLSPPSFPPFFRPNAPFPTLPLTPSFAFPPIGHFSTQPPRRSSRNSMTSELLDDDAQVQRARAEAKAAKAREVHAAKQNTSSTPSLETAGQPVKRRSRLPSNKAPRKRPLSADGRPPSISKRNTLVQRHAARSKTNQQRSTKKSMQHATLSITSESDSKRSSLPYPSTSESDSKRGTPGPSSSAFLARHDTPTLDHPYRAPSISRTQRTVLDTDDEISHPPSSHSAEGTAEIPSPAAADSPFHAPSQNLTTTPPKGPRPRYSYTIPEKLHGVHIALGQDNWNEYLALMEDLWTGDITGEEFATGTRRICMFADDRIRKRMNNIMAMQIVVPHLAQLSPDGGRGRREKMARTLAG